MLATGRRIQEADLLEDEAVVAAGRDLLHDLASPVLGEVARVAEPCGPAVGDEELRRDVQEVALLAKTLM